MGRLVLFASVIISSIILLSATSSYAQAKELDFGNITGKILVKGERPMSGGTVFFFHEASGPPPSATKYWRVPTHAFKIDDKGAFNAMLPVGKYYMGASKKFSGQRIGPPSDGDYFFISQDESGNARLHSVNKNETLNMGSIAEAKPFNRQMLVTAGITSIEGTIYDEKGAPVEGMLVFAFPTPTMVGRPMYVSEKSDRNGKYLLRLAGGGAYYLRARASYGGGPPAADQAMGFYNEGKALNAKDGESRAGIDITVSGVGVPE